MSKKEQIIKFEEKAITPYLPPNPIKNGFKMLKIKKTRKATKITKEIWGKSFWDDNPAKAEAKKTSSCLGRISEKIKIRVWQTMILFIFEIFQI